MKKFDFHMEETFQKIKTRKQPRKVFKEYKLERKQQRRNKEIRQSW